ncbi:MAG: hypothetical protein GF392_04280, partial [Candidatus Omnitrophica bacterium]|nr:hypothetical protein [Candidatus Omnitrophota bacterium]
MLRAEASWYDGDDDPGYSISAATRILGSGRALKAELARLEQQRYKAAELNRIREIRYEWDLADNELTIAMRQARMLERALRRTEERVRYVLNAKIAEHALGGGTNIRQIRRLIDEYEGLRARYFKANIRMNIAYARAVYMLNNLQGVEHTAGLLEGLKSSSDRRSAAAGKRKRSGPEELGAPIAERTDIDAPELEKKEDSDRKAGAEPERGRSDAEREKGRGHGDDAREGNGFPAHEAENAPVVKEDRVKDISKDEDRSDRVPTPSSFTIPEEHVPASASVPYDTTGFFNGLRRDIGIIHRDLSGREDGSRDKEAVVCDVDPVDGSGRYTIRWIREEGEIVKKGDPVVRFDASFLERQRDAQLKLIGETDSLIVEAREVLREAKKRKKAFRGQHEEEVKAVETKMRSGEEMVRRAEQRIRLSEDNIELARKHVKRLKALKKKGLVSEFEYHRAREAEQAALEAQYEASADRIKAERVLEEAGARVRVLEEALARETAALDGIIKDARGDMRSAKRKLELQNRKLDLLNRNIAGCTLYAVREGMVMYSNVTGVYLFTIPLDPALETVIGPGVSIAKGQEVMRIVDPDSKLFRPRPSERGGGNVVRSSVSTAHGSRQGNMGVPIREIVPEGSRVEKGDVVARMEDSVLLSLRSKEKENLLGSTRRATEAASRLASARRTRSTYLHGEYPALVKEAEARLSGARSVHEARKKEARLASERTVFLKERLAKAEELSKRDMVSQTEIDSLRTVYNSARMEEAADRSEMEIARYMEAAAEAALERVHAEHARTMASMDREIATAREEQRLAEKDVEVDRKRMAFYSEQIENCVIRAERSGTVFYMDNLNITMNGASLRPVLNELTVGENAIIPVGVPFARIKDSERSEDPPVVSAGLRSFTDSRREERRSADRNRVSVNCRIKPLRFYNIVGYGATLKYVAPDGGYVSPGDKLAEFDATVFERERDLQQRLVNETELYIESARQRLAEAEKLKKAATGRYRAERKILMAKVSAGEKMLAEAGKKMEAAEANVLLARNEVRRTATLVKSSVASSADRVDSLLSLNAAEKAVERVRAEAAEARRILGEAGAGLDALEAAYSRETAGLEDMIERARDNIRAADNRLGLQKVRLELIKKNIENCVIRAAEAGKVEYSDHVNTSILGFRVDTVPRDVSIGPRITIPYGQEILSIDTSVGPGKTADSGKADKDITFVEADVSTAYDSGAGVIYPTIKKIYVEDGQNVREGQLLAELETAVLEDLREEAEARFRESERSVSNAASVLAGARKRYLEYVNGEYPSLLTRARSALRQADKAYNAREKTRVSAEKIAGLRKEILEMGKTLLASDNASTREIEALRAAYNTALMRANTASYEEADALLRSREARVAPERLEYERLERVAALEREMDTARGRLRLAEENRGRDRDRVDFYSRQIAGCVIRAPASGKVTFMHSLPVNILGLPLKSVPKERVIGPDATAGPGPFMKITDDGSSEQADAGPYDPRAGNGLEVLPKGGTPVRCGMEPVTFGRMGEHGSMVLQIAPEGKVKKGQLLVRFDTSAQERLQMELSERLNDNRMLSLDSAGVIENCEERISILAAKMSILETLQSSMARGGGDMSAHARRINELADENVALADKAVQRTIELMKNMLASRIETGTRGIEAREERVIRNRALRELAVAVLTREEGENIFAVMKSRVDQEQGLLGGIMERARIDREAAEAEKNILSRKIELVKENMEKAAVYAREDGWILYAHDTGETFAGIPVTYSADPVYIGTGCVVKNGQPVMSFYREKPDTYTPAASGAREKGVKVISDVRTGDSDRNGPRGGRILEVPLNDGDHVEKGDPVLILDPADLKEMKRREEIRLEEAARAAERYNSSRAEAKKRLDALLTGEYPARLEQLNAVLIEAGSLIATARKRVGASGAAADLKENKYRQLRKLRQRGIASLSEVESARAEWNRALLRRERAEYELDSIAVAIAEAEYAIGELEAEKSRRKADIEADIRVLTQRSVVADESVRIQQRKVGFYEEQIENCVIRAPASGVITYNEEVSYTFLADHWVPRDIIITPGYEIPPGITVAEISDAASGSGDRGSFFGHSFAGAMAFILLMAGIIRKIYRQIRAGLDMKFHEDPRHIGPPDRTNRRDMSPDRDPESPGTSADYETERKDRAVPEDHAAEQGASAASEPSERKENSADADIPPEDQGMETAIDDLNARLYEEFQQALPGEDPPPRYILQKTDWMLSLDRTQINELFMNRRMKMREYIAEAAASGGG